MSTSTQTKLERSFENFIDELIKSNPPAEYLEVFRCFFFLLEKEEEQTLIELFKKEFPQHFAQIDRQN